MIRYFAKRIIEAIPVLLIIATLVFFMVRFVPGGPFDRERELPPETKEALNAYYGLDKPMLYQYVDYLKNLAHGELGPSFKYSGWSVNEILTQKAKVSLQLGAQSLVIALFFGIFTGFGSAKRRGTAVGEVLNVTSMLGICLPALVIGPILILVFSLELGWVNAMGWKGALTESSTLPSITLALFYAAWIARLSRSGALEESRKNYVRTAIAKGASPERVWAVHIFPNAIQPVVSYIGPAAAGLLTGSFVVETIFQIPGLGKFFISSALDNDYTMIMGCVILYATFIIAFNLLSDFALALINPRIASEMRGKDK